jgi:hypothetical protein
MSLSLWWWRLEYTPTRCTSFNTRQAKPWKPKLQLHACYNARITKLPQTVIPSETQRHVVRWKSTYVWEEHVTSTLRVDEYAKQKTSVKKAASKLEVVLLATCLRLVPYLAYSSTMKLEVTCSSQTYVDFQRTTWRYMLYHSLNYSL